MEEHMRSAPLWPLTVPLCPCKHGLCHSVRAKAPTGWDAAFRHVRKPLGLVGEVDVDGVVGDALVFECEPASTAQGLASP